MAFTLELDRVTKAYDEFIAVDNLSFKIPEGEIFGLLGPNGAGKTSSIRMMIGITVPDSGAVRIFGQPLTRRLLDRVGYLPEERGLYKKMKIIENLVFLGAAQRPQCCQKPLAAAISGWNALNLAAGPTPRLRSSPRECSRRCSSSPRFSTSPIS